MANTKQNERRAMAPYFWTTIIIFILLMHHVRCLTLPLLRDMTPNQSLAKSDSVAAAVATTTISFPSQVRQGRRAFLATAPAVIIGFLSVDPALATSSEIIIDVVELGGSLGLELQDVKIGTPPQPVTAIKRIVVPNDLNKRLRSGMVLRDFSSAREVQKRLDQGPFPVRLVFYDLAAQGDAIADLGTPIVSSQDALTLAQTTSTSISNNATKGDTYSKIIVQHTNCNLRSRRGDVLEIRYEARIDSPTGRIYDSSEFRGTGQPYQMVLGSGDMLPGVDLGLYEMCPGEIRVLQIPPPLAYGRKGNKLFRIPPDANLVWIVELISVNSVTEGDPRTREELESRAEY